MRISDWSSDVCSSDLLSGPAILQISSYWQPGQEIEIDLQPGQDGFELLRETKAAKPKQELHMLLSEGLPRRLALMLCEEAGLGGRLADLSDKKLRAIAGLLNRWRLRPGGTDGFRTAAVRSEEQTSEIQPTMRTPYALI